MRWPEIFSWYRVRVLRVREQRTSFPTSHSVCLSPSLCLSPVCEWGHSEEAAICKPEETAHRHSARPQPPKPWETKSYCLCHLDCKDSAKPDETRPRDKAHLPTCTRRASPSKGPALLSPTCPLLGSALSLPQRSCLPPGLEAPSSRLQ